MCNKKVCENVQLLVKIVQYRPRLTVKNKDPYYEGKQCFSACNKVAIRRNVTLDDNRLLNLLT